jgi:hypothetical protein
MDNLLFMVFLSFAFFTLMPMQSPNPARKDIEIIIAPFNPYAPDDLRLSREAVGLSKILSEKLYEVSVNPTVSGPVHEYQFSRMTVNAREEQLKLLLPLMQKAVEKKKISKESEELNQHLDQLTEGYSANELQDLLAVARELEVALLVSALERRIKLQFDREYCPVLKKES